MEEKIRTLILLRYRLNAVNCYQKLIKELDINATRKNKSITQKLSELSYETKKSQKFLEKTFNKHKEKKPDSE